jgi:hypothetical protein
MDYEKAYKELCYRLATQYTPQGSEFHMDPDRCLRWIQDKMDADRDIIKGMHVRINSSPILRFLWRRTSLGNRRR